MYTHAHTYIKVIPLLVQKHMLLQNVSLNMFINNILIVCFFTGV